MCNAIDREKVINGLEECLSASCRGFKLGIYCPMSDEVWNNVRDALALLKANEPIRCKDCTYFVANNAEEGDWSGRCTNIYLPMNGITVDGWWFCADGARR